MNSKISQKLPLSALFIFSLIGKMMERALSPLTLESSREMTTAGVAIVLQGIGAMFIPMAVLYMVRKPPKRKGLLILFVSSALFEFFYDLICFGKLFDPRAQNPLFSLLLAGITLCFFKEGNKALYTLSAVAGGVFWAIVIKSEGGLIAVTLAALAMLLNKKRTVSPFIIASYMAIVAALNPIYALTPLGIAVTYCNPKIREWEGEKEF